jgi:5'-methylthioadenosine phosphorylase
VEPARPVGIMGGSGLHEFMGELAEKGHQIFHTPYGVVECSTGRWADVRVVFIPRHGPEHDFPPHKVKFKANIWALNELGVRQVVGTCAVGTLNEKLKPGTITVPDQLIDMTKETRSFFNGRKEGVRHADMSEPFCPVLREVARETAVEIGLETRTGGTYICFSGPTFETAAEIRMARMLGADVVGMTLAPEAKLCREMGICYLPLCMPVNWAAGMTKEMLTHRQTLEGVNLMKGDLVKLMRFSIERFPRERDCPCARALVA